MAIRAGKWLHRSSGPCPFLCVIKDVIVYRLGNADMETFYAHLTLLPAPDEVLAPFERDAELLLPPKPEPPKTPLSPSESQPGDYFGAPPPGMEKFLMQAMTVAGTIATTTLGAWLRNRYGRKVRIKVGDIEAEASTAEEIDQLLLRAQALKQAIEPKRIYEP